MFSAFAQSSQDSQLPQTKFATSLKQQIQEAQALNDQAKLPDGQVSVVGKTIVIHTALQQHPNGRSVAQRFLNLRQVELDTVQSGDGFFSGTTISPVLFRSDRVSAKATLNIFIKYGGVNPYVSITCRKIELEDIVSKQTSSYNPVEGNYDKALLTERASEIIVLSLEEHMRSLSLDCKYKFIARN